MRNEPTAADARPSRGALAVRRRRLRRRRGARGGGAAGGESTAASSPARSPSTAPRPSARSPRPRPSCSTRRTPTCKITVGTSGTGGGFEKFCAGETDISDASRPIKDDEEAPVCEKSGVDVHRGPDRQRRHRRRDQQGPRGRLPHDRPAQADLEQGLEGHVALRGRPEAARHRALALRPGHRLGHVRLLHRRDQRRGGRDAARTTRPPRTTTSSSRASPATRAASATSASPTTRAPRTSSTWSASTPATACVKPSQGDDPGRLLQAALAPAVHVPERRRRWSGPRSRRSWTSSSRQAPTIAEAAKIVPLTDEQATTAKDELAKAESGA